MRNDEYQQIVDRVTKKVNLSNTFRIFFHRPNGVLDGYFNNINGNNLKEVLNTLPKLWIAVVFNISENEFQFSRNNF